MSCISFLSLLSDFSSVSEMIPKYPGGCSSFGVFIVCKCPQPHIFVFCRLKSENEAINSAVCCGCAKSAI